MKYTDSGQAIAMAIMRRKNASEIQKNLIKIYLDEKNEKEQNKLLGMIDTINDCKTFKKAKLFDKLDEYKRIVQKINNFPDEDFFCEKSYYEGCCDGIRRLIGLNKELRVMSKKIFIIFFTANADIEFEIHSAFLINENNTEIFEYNDSVEPEKNYFSVTSDADNIINLLQEKDDEHEYIVVISYNSEHTHNINDVKLISDLCEDNFYLLNIHKENKIINTSEYIKKIIKEIK